MGQQSDKNKSSYWWKKGAIVAFILFLVVALFDFILIGEFKGVITLCTTLILLFLYLVYFSAGVPIILKLRGTESSKKSIWVGIGLSLIPLSIGGILIIYELFKQLRGGPSGGDDLFFGIFYTLVFMLFTILIGWVIGKIRYGNHQ